MSSERQESRYAKLSDLHREDHSCRGSTAAQDAVRNLNSARSECFPSLRGDVFANVPNECSMQRPWIREALSQGSSRSMPSWHEAVGECSAILQSGFVSHKMHFGVGLECNARSIEFEGVVRHARGAPVKSGLVIGRRWCAFRHDRRHSGPRLNQCSACDSTTSAPHKCGFGSQFMTQHPGSRKNRSSWVDRME